MDRDDWNDGPATSKPTVSLAASLLPFISVRSSLFKSPQQRDQMAPKGKDGKALLGKNVKEDCMVEVRNVFEFEDNDNKWKFRREEDKTEN
ncbi:hypothetical protein E2C01_080450 [Portunus trituberculatus]|uniref:Uncharacterized protein n=1 Tax=Portunus trituberculatus TaxID=210409 RepID=A0A5B7IW60_PORTR|nr:hypothetical protein [Portunus trituberculatus]